MDHDRYTAELSTGQLVIGVCILLMFGLGCFLLGVLIGKFDPTLKPGATTTAASDGGAAPEVKVATVTVSPPPQSQPAVQPSDPSMPPEMRVPPRILNETAATPPQPQPQPQTNAAPAETKPAPSEATPPAAEPAAAAKSEPSVAETVSAAAEKNKVAPPSAAPQAVDTAKAAAPAPEPTKATAATAKTDGPWKGYGVQVVAVAKDRAESARAALEAKSSYKAKVLPHVKNSLFRVVVGPFESQAAASRARDELRTKFGYKDAFVLTLQ